MRAVGSKIKMENGEVGLQLQLQLLSRHCGSAKCMASRNDSPDFYQKDSTEHHNALRFES